MFGRRDFHCDFIDKDVDAIELPTGKEICKKVADCALITRTCSFVKTYNSLSPLDLSLLPIKEVFTA